MICSGYQVTGTTFHGTTKGLFQTAAEGDFGDINSTRVITISEMGTLNHRRRFCP
jgi:hypothetical protein